MNPRIVKKPRVEHDLVQHFAYIAGDKLQPAERFLKVAEETFSRIAAMPTIGRNWESPHPQLAGIRVYPMPSGFRRYLICYRPIAGGIEVLTTLHGARDLEAALTEVLPADSPGE